MAIATLSIDIEAKLARLEADMGKAARIAEKRTAEMNRNLEKLRSIGAGVGAALGAYFTVDVFKNVIVGSANALDALNDLKDATGSSIENLSALEYVAMRNGETLDSVGGILVKFNNVLKEADGKNGVSQALQAIGLDAEELKKIDPAQALERVAVALKGFADDGTKARIVQDLFGKSVREAAPFLNDLADMGLKNATATTAQAAAAEQFNKNLAQLNTNISLAARSTVGELIPALNQLLTTLNNEGFLALFGFDSKFDRAKNLAAKAKELRDAKTELDRINGVGVAGFLYSRIGEKRKAEERPGVEARYQRALKDFRSANAVEKNLRNEERLGPLYAGYVPRQPDLAGPPVPGDMLARRLASAAEDAAKVVKKASAGAKSSAPTTRLSEELRYIEALRERVEKTKELSAVEQVLADIEAGRVKFTPAQAEQAKGMARMIDQAKAYEEVMRELSETETQAMRDLRARQEDMARRADQYLSAALTDAQRLAATFADIRTLYDAGAFGAVGSAEAIEKMNTALEGAKRGTDELTGSYRDLADAIKAALFDGADLGEMLENIAKKKLLIEPLSNAIDNLFKGLQNGGGGVAGGGGGGLGNLLGLGNLFSSIGGLFGFADGGEPPMGRPSWVGERGPELFVPKQRGTIVPNHKLGGVGGTVVNITQHVSIGEGVSAAQVAAAMNYTKEATTQSVMQALRRNNPGLVA